MTAALRRWATKKSYTGGSVLRPRGQTLVLSRLSFLQGWSCYFPIDTPSARRQWCDLGGSGRVSGDERQFKASISRVSGSC